MKREAGLGWPPEGHLLSRGRWRGSNTQRRGVRSDQKGKDNQKNMVSGSQEGKAENDAQCQMLPRAHGRQRLDMVQCLQQIKR